MKEDTIWVPHDHNCSHCGTVWFHDPIDVITANLEERFEDADTLNRVSHECPSCGKEEYYIAQDDTPPQYLKDGRTCERISGRIPTVDTLETHNKREKLKQHMRETRLRSLLDILGGGRK